MGLGLNGLLRRADRISRRIYLRDYVGEYKQKIAMIAPVLALDTDRSAVERLVVVYQMATLDQSPHRAMDGLCFDAGYLGAREQMEIED